MECVEHGFQVCRCPAHIHAHRHTETCARQLLRYAESKKAASTSHTVPSVCAFCAFLKKIFSIFFFLTIHLSFPSWFPHPPQHSGWQIQLPMAPSQCLMECRSLWPLAVCLCTSCTCLCLTSNSTTHIHSLSHTQRHGNAHVWP